MLCAKSFQDAKTVFDPVVGDIPVPARYESCGMSRIKSDICGAEGKKWEPKSKKQFFIAIKNSEKLENDRSHS